ncbi:MAG: hypothetical protein II442_05550, partial [Oscillospiraceae bacterium]|nr:hypothetical protein [Oscillospiraceae bacterium]
FRSIHNDKPAEAARINKGVLCRFSFDCAVPILFQIPCFTHPSDAANGHTKDLTKRPFSGTL